MARRPRPGASYADFRFERLVTADLTIRDTAVQSATDAVTTGYAVRVIVDGTWGFAASVGADRRRGGRAPPGRRSRWPGRWPAWSPSGWSGPTSRSTATRSGSATTTSTRSPWPATDKIALLLDRSERLLAADGVAHTSAGLFQVKENKFYADTAGTSDHPAAGAAAADADRDRGRHRHRGVRDDVQPDPAGRPRLRVPDRRHLGFRRARSPRWASSSRRR